MKYRKPVTQSPGEPKSTNNTQREADLKGSVDFKHSPKQRLGRPNKSIYRPALREKAANAAKIAKVKEEMGYPLADRVDIGQRLRGRRVSRTG